MLQPTPKVMLFGDEAGTAEAARNMGTQYVPHIEVNEFGTPTLNGLFAAIEVAATSPYVALVNADILLLQDFSEAVARVSAFHRKFLMIGRRRNMRLTEELSFDVNWGEKLRRDAANKSLFYDGIDYFVFPRDLWGTVPPFAIGRYEWDNWLLYGARTRRAIVVDATAVVLAVHQDHEVVNNKETSIEMARNKELITDNRQRMTAKEATHIMTESSIRNRCTSCYPLCVCGPEYLVGTITGNDSERRS